MRRKTVVAGVLAALALFLSVYYASGDDDGDGVVTYPDGRWGMDIGGGYQTTPDGENLMPQDYRAPLADSYYGPMTPKGYEFFPSFEFPDSAARDKKERAMRKEYREMMIMPEVTSEATTVTAPRKRTLLWGYSSPVKGDYTAN